MFPIIVKIATCLSGVHYRRNEHMTANTYMSGQITALYARLSQEDALDGDSNSIVNHERFLKLSVEYEAEQRELTEKVNAEQREFDTDFLLNRRQKQKIPKNRKRRHSPCGGYTA